MKNYVSPMGLALVLSILLLSVSVSSAEDQADLSIEFSNVKVDSKQRSTALEPGDASIVEIAVSDGRFTTLVAALDAAGLVETLQGEGPFTVFAPTDEAFAALPQGTVEALLADIPALTDVLLYHVVTGSLPAADVINLKRARTVLGSELKFDLSNGVRINSSNVVITDIAASNGIIHVIDAVLLPSDAADDLGTSVPAAVTVYNDGSGNAENFLLQVKAGERLVLQQRINKLRAEQKRYIDFEYIPVSEGETVLTATVDPFNLLSENDEGNNSTSATYLANKVRGRDLLLGDISLSRNSLKDFSSVQVDYRIYNVGSRNARNFDYRVYLTNSPKRVDGRAVLVAEGSIKKLRKGQSIDMSTVVDASLLRDQNDFYFWGEVDVDGNVGEANEANNARILAFGKKGLANDMLDLVETAIAADGFDILVQAVSSAGLVDALRTGQAFTVFAPTDEAFAALPQGLLANLLEDTSTLSNILLYHVKTGEYKAADVIEKSSLHMANNVEASISIKDGKVFIDDAQIIVTDIPTGNGVIHVISSVIVPE